MATRSTISIKSHRGTTHLYRHWDGYPAATGAHLGHVLRSLPAPTHEAVLAALLTAKEGELHGSGRYEITDEARNHTDRQWHYEITLKPREEPTVLVMERWIGGTMPGAVAFNGRLFEFRRFAARYVRDLHRMIKRRNAA